MASSNLPVRPRLPLFESRAENEEQYRQDLRDYTQLLVQALEEAFRQLDTPGLVSASAFNLVGFPTNGSDLPVGGVFIDGGLLRVVREGEIFVDTLQASTALGAVTVSTP